MSLIRYSLIGMLAFSAYTLTACTPQPKPVAPRAAMQQPAPQRAQSASAMTQQGQMTNYGDPGLARFAAKLANSTAQKTHVVQLGDSHTAADYFTGALRNLMQQQYGDGGVGFISPIAVPGNRNAQVIFNKSPDWTLATSRKETDPAFTFGGLLATPARANSSAQFTLRDTAPVTNAQALYRSQQPDALTLNNQTITLADSGGAWRLSPPVTVTSPVRFTLAQPTSQLAGWLLTRPGGGVMVSASGINGAQITMPDRWQPAWIDSLRATAPDLLILSFGTNEAFNTNLDLEAYRADLRKQVHSLRQGLPGTVILLMSPGSSIIDQHAKTCATREPHLLPQIVEIQRQVARQERTLFWDWFTFMGKDCGWDRWSAKGLMRDKVHLTLEGYQVSAEAFWQQLSALLPEA